MGKIEIKNAFANNLKNVNIEIPLEKLVAVVGKSGSGKSSLVYNVLYEASRGHDTKATISKLPKTYVIAQKVKPMGNSSLGETNLNNLNKILREIKSGDLLIVDEPCAGMAKIDRINIISILKETVKKGISVIVVEHSKDVIINSDYIIEFGPESGAKGGEIIFKGSIEKFRKSKTTTSEYVFSDKASLVDYRRSPNDKAKIMQNKKLSIKEITKYNLKDFNLEFPLGSLVCISGEMGTGKSALLSVVYGALFKGKGAWKLKQGFKSIEGKTNVRRSYLVDQSSLSSISTSTPATYLGIWDSIRDLFASLPESKKAGLTKADFSFNKKMNKEVQYNEKSIFDVLEMTIDQAINLFSDSSLVVRKLSFLQEVGLGYLTLGQKSGTLSGGESQRVRLAKILSKKLGDRCIYILDIPSRGLHLSNLPVLVKVFQKIIDKNNTVLIAENKEELIENCDCVINLTK
ncbi:MAG: ATP-binding cassette domain-containing protein [Candidatus Shapirobacteria bacterium]|nr:ATP-binding cassette domain-containing protein [Candidatus Shapirobacteria bacterium]MDD3002653.1 ATP-binding cassette domain-containing protein [Candidatus Shapirobacteria bacterium]MDD4382834.1 ATP-binding cassette domain-containing protein [Candidatus Shapirobacteria bacterium]